MKFRKKPVVIDAVQFDASKPLPEGVRLGDGDSYEVFESTAGKWIPGLSCGDWIITGVKGERYWCKPEVFEATYEPAE